MARSKSWTESQQPENQYTHGQYWFNVIAMLLIALALVAFVIWWIRPAPTATTSVFLVRSNAESELRSIPFQENDFRGLIDNFVNNEVVELDDFNDKESFDLSASLSKNTNGESTTAIVICSAIGSVDDSNPVLMPTTASGESIGVDQFLKDFVSSVDCQRYVVVFDCGHDFSRPFTYLGNSSFEEGQDFNKFASAVGTLVETSSFEKPLAVITANGDGEIPLYSYNQRRTLFGLAIQESLSRKHETVDKLHQSLVDYCHQYGGEAAQTPRLFKSPKFAECKLGIAKLETPKKEEDTEKESESEGEPPVQDEATSKDLVQIASSWRERDEVESRFASEKETLLLPADFDTAEWERSINKIVEKSVGLRNLKLSSSTNIGEFGQSGVLREARSKTAMFPGLLSSPQLVEGTNSVPESNQVDPRAKRDIAKAFRTHHHAKLKTKYYIAIFEALSWLDDSPSLKAYEGAINDLQLTLGSDLFADEKANESDLSRFVEAGREISDKLKDVDYRLKNVCRFLGGNSENKHGFTREMALMCLLDSPLVESGSEDAEVIPEAHDRMGLMNALKRSIDGRGDLMTPEQRKSNSARRNKIFDGFRTLCSPPDARAVNLRKHDSIAYYLSVGRSKLLDLTVKPRPVVHTVLLEDRAELVKTKQIDLEETEIDLGLSVKSGAKSIETKVNLVCELAPDAPFKILNGTTDGNKIRIDGSNGLIQIKATENAAIDGTASRHFLKINVEDEYLDKVFTRNEAKAIEIPLALPGEDRIELILAMSGKSVTGSALRPMPNREEVLEMSLRNFFHRGRTVRATLYPCKLIDGHEIMPGNIDDQVKRGTLLDLRRLPPIAVSTPLKLEKGKPGEPAEPIKISWSTKANPNLKMLSPDEPIIQGLLCQVVETPEEEEGGADKNLEEFWIPLFPETKDFLSSKNLLLDPDTGKVQLAYVKSGFCVDQSIKLVCRLGDQKIGGLTIPAGENTGSGIVIENWGLFETKSKNELLHIDVDGWPRRYSFIFENGRFLDALPIRNSRFPNIAFDVKLPKPDSPMIKLTKVTSDDNKVRRAFGYKSKDGDRKVEGELKITCNTQDHFRFPDSRDFVEVQFGNEVKKHFFPRDVNSFAFVDPTDPTRLILQSKVTDFFRELEIEMDEFVIDPKAIVLGDDVPTEMNGSDVTKIIFDDRPPESPRFQIASRVIYPGRFVEIQLSQPADAPGGVGISKRIKDRTRATIRSGGGESKKVALGYNSERSLGIKAGEPGEYELSLSIFDRLGNFGQSTTKSFRVVPLPPKPKKEPKKIVKAPTAPITHVLKVVVEVGSRRLQAGQDPELVIEPNEGVKMKRANASTFEFTGLKTGETYSVSGTLKLTSGFGIETKGKTKKPFEIAKDAETKVTATRKLVLEQ